MTKALLTEAAKAPTKGSNGRWRVTVATPGQGSSGYYSPEVLREYGPRALQPGAQSFINHDPDRNPKDMIGTFPEGATWNEELQVLEAELEVFPHWVEFVEAVGPHAGMSIYFQGERDEDGNVTKLFENDSNGCDLVARPGLKGSGLDEKLYESLREQALQDAEQDTQVEALEAKIEALTTAFEAYVEAQKESKEEENAPKPEDLVAEAVAKFDEAVELIEGAELLPSQATDLRERAKAGEDITAAVETAKSIKDELVEQYKANEAQDEGVGNIRGTQVESALELGKVLG